jgi:hypothetical protein
MRGDWVACQTKHYWSFQRKLGGPEASTDLIAGGAFAKGLEVFRKCYYGPQKLSIADAYKEGSLAAIQEYGDHNAPEYKEAKSVQQVVEGLADYIAHYPPASDHIQPYFPGGSGDPAVEFTFSLPLPINHPETGEPFLYAGRFDMLGVRNEQLVVVDEKTTSQLGPTWINKWNLRGQFTGYIWACQQYGYPVLGAVVRGISFLKPSVKNPDKPNFGHAEALQMRAQWEIDQWYDQLLHDVEDMVTQWKRGWFNQAFDEACAAFSGCPFQSMCKSSTPESWVSKFMVRDWDPLKKVPYIQPEQKPTELIALPEGV